MPRAIKTLGLHEPRVRIVDTLILTAAQRRTQHGSAIGEKGTHVTFDFAEPVALRTDDALLLDDGNVVEVVAAPELLVEARGDTSTLTRLAWLLGDRHVPVQILPNRIRLQRDPGLESLLAESFGKITVIEAPFEPEGGAYAGQVAHEHGGHHHHHHHDHHHSHSHAHAGGPAAGDHESHDARSHRDGEASGGHHHKD